MWRKTTEFWVSGRSPQHVELKKERTIPYSETLCHLIATPTPSSGHQQDLLAGEIIFQRKRNSSTRVYKKCVKCGLFKISACSKPAPPNSILIWMHMSIFNILTLVFGLELPTINLRPSSPKMLGGVFFHPLFFSFFLSSLPAHIYYENADPQSVYHKAPLNPLGQPKYKYKQTA